MAMRVEKLTETHRSTVCGWWPARGEGEMPDGILPPDGLVCSDAEGPAAAVWIYHPAGVPLGIVDWLVARPGLRMAAARKAARALFAAVAEDARARGITRVFITVSRDGMVREAQACGFTTVATGATHLMIHL